MRFLWLFIILIIGLVNLTYAKDVNIDLLLRCIADVESHDVFNKIGAHGERSQYQIMYDTWTMYSKVPFNQAGQSENQPEVQRVVKMHIGTIKKAILKRGWKVNPYNIALAWNGGPNRLVYLFRNKDYAERVSNLYTSGPACM